jgi:uncharacterized protein YihD (DUF1040 family)
LKKQQHIDNHIQRDPQRIPKIVSALSLLWQQFPDMRLGQLIEGFALQEGLPDAFYLTDEDLFKNIAIMAGLSNAKIEELEKTTLQNDSIHL